MPKSGAAKPNGSSSSAKTDDSRFANFESDPRFRLPSKKSTKTALDKRFSRMLSDEDFTVRAKVDRYGRKLHSDNKKRILNLYREEDEDEDEDEDNKSRQAAIKSNHVPKRKLQSPDVKYDPARGGGYSSSDSDSGSDIEEDEEDHDEGGAAVETSGSMQRLRDEQADVETGEITNRLAIVNMDWDMIQSSDLFSLFSSFLPEGGKIKHIAIYPSEFGKQRMQREELEGPPREIFKKSTKSDDGFDHDSKYDSDEEEGADDENIKKDLLQEADDQDFDSAALRSYQLDRLRYYYGVISCSDKATAQKIYETIDGTEYQSSSNFLDLRFIPDDVTFDEEPRDECKSMPTDYRPTEFVTDALQHSKVKLTWDIHPEESTRRENIKRAFGGSRSELLENDLKAYLASDSENDDGPQEQEGGDGDEPKLTKKELARQRMREALGLSTKPEPQSSKSEPVGELEMTFALGDAETKEKKKPIDKEETTVEKYIRKEREKKARKKELAVAKREGVNATEAIVEEVVDQNEDLGFDDPFFTTNEPTKVTKSSQRKEERLKKRELKEAEARERAAQKAQLQQIMGDDSKDADDHLDHFDINEIARAEKKKFKKGKSKKNKSVEDRGGLQEGFKMDLDDNRFTAVFENHEFAIDPSNPKFKATPGMKELLQEGRKKRNHGEDAPSQNKKKARRH